MARPAEIVGAHRPKMAKNGCGQKVFLVAKNGRKWPKMAENGQNSKTFKLVTIYQNWQLKGTNLGLFLSSKPMPAPNIGSGLSRGGGHKRRFVLKWYRELYTRLQKWCSFLHHFGRHLIGKIGNIDKGVGYQREGKISFFAFLLDQNSDQALLIKIEEQRQLLDEHRLPKIQKT